MLRPRPDERGLEILSGEAANSVFGQALHAAPTRPSRKATATASCSRPRRPQASDVFLTVMPMSDDAAPDLPVHLAEAGDVFVLSMANRVVVLSRTGRLLEKPFEVEAPAGGESQILAVGLAPGQWSLRGRSGKVRLDARVEDGKNTAYFVVPAGVYEVSPKAVP